MSQTIGQSLTQLPTRLTDRTIPTAPNLCQSVPPITLERDMRANLLDAARPMSARECGLLRKKRVGGVRVDALFELTQPDVQNLDAQPNFVLKRKRGN